MNAECHHLLIAGVPCSRYPDYCEKCRIGMLGRNCSTGCLTKDHLTWGECVRGKRMQLNPNLADTNVQKAWDKELDSYESAVRQGVQPDGTKQHQVDAAMRKAEAAN